MAGGVAMSTLSQLIGVNRSTPLNDNSSRSVMQSADCNVTHTAGCNKPQFDGPFKLPDNGTMLRTFYVILGLTAIVIVYFIVRAVRTRRKNSSSKRYGLLNTPDDNVEMRRLADEDDEDDNDNMLFDRTRERLQ